MKSILAAALIASLAVAGAVHADDAKAMTFTLQGGAVACMTEDGYKQILEYANDDDVEAAQKFVGDLSNGCIVTASAKAVYIESLDPGANAVQLRVKGFTGKFWTSMNFVN